MEFAEKCLKETEKYNVSFADVRIFDTLNETLIMQNGVIDTSSNIFEQGFNVRVILSDSWGYATATEIHNKTIPFLVKQAVDVAKANSKKLRKPVELTSEPTVKDRYITPFKKDSFEIDIKTKLEFLINADEAIKEVSNQIVMRRSYVDAYKINLNFASSEGSEIFQQQNYVGCGVSALAKGTDIQRRSHRDYQMKGFEHVENFNMEEEAKRVAQEALTLVNDAINAPSGKTNFILEPDKLGLAIHESTGHPTELDRVMGFEADFAGTSFLTLDKYKTDYKYGSELTNLVVNPDIPGGLGSIKYDDEGVKTKKFHIIKEGIFQNYMTDRETAKEIGLPHSFGNARIANYNRLPIVRMGNIHLEPDKNGPKNIEEMIEETSDGIIAMTWKSHSIDDKRINFQFSTEMGWQIKNGEKIKPLKNLIYNAHTPTFWGGLDMVTQDFTSYGHGPICGKGIPMQGMWISHGGAYARFQDVNVFSG